MVAPEHMRMARFLSPDWFDAVAAATAEAGVPAAAGSAPVLTLQQLVTGGPEGDVEYTVTVVSGGGISVTPGRAAGPDVTITQDYATALALHEGRLTAQHAFMAGRVKVRGDVTALVTHQATLAPLDPMLAQVAGRGRRAGVDGVPGGGV
jgi:hypothetical protein